MIELPLAGAGCSLDAQGAERQLERYARLGASLAGAERSELSLVARFGAGLDGELLREALAVERSCCSFLSIAFDPRERRLELTVSDRRHAPALAAIEGALAP